MHWIWFCLPQYTLTYVDTNMKHHVWSKLVLAQSKQTINFLISKMNIDHFGDIIFGKRAVRRSIIPNSWLWVLVWAGVLRGQPVHVTPALAGLELSFSPDSADLAKYDQSSVTSPMSVLVWAWPLHYRKQGWHDPHVLWGFLSISWWL